MAKGLNLHFRNFCFCQGGETLVFWDFKRYPLPNDADLPWIYKNIKSVLEEEHHFTGFVEIMAYGLPLKKYKPSWLLDAHCTCVPEEDIMTLDIMYSARKTPLIMTTLDRCNIALIAKEESEVDSELLWILKGLVSRNHAVWLLQPPEEGKPFDFRNKRVLQGGSRPQMPLLPITGSKAGVFWDVEDYPFPDEDPDSIYDKIVTALKFRIGDAKMCIWAYVDETEEYWKDKLSKKTWNASIYFRPRGDKRMLHDVIFWGRDFPPEGKYNPSYMVVIANISSRTCDEELFFQLGTYNWHNYSVWTIPPSVDVSPEEPWPKRVLDQVKPLVEEETETESGQASPKHEGSEDQG